MKKIWIWLMVFFVGVVILLAEKSIPRRIADLEKRLNGVTGNAKVDLLNQLAEESIRHEPLKTIEYARQALTLSRDLKYPGGEAGAYINLGMGYSIKGKNYQESLGYYHQGLKWFEKQEDKKQIAGIYNKMGIVYRNLSRYQEALEYYRKSLEIYKHLGSPKGIARVLNNMGNVYDGYGIYDRALEYFIKSAKITEKSGEIRDLAASLTNIGTIHWRTRDYDKALEYFKKVLVIDEKIGNKSDIAGSLNNIGLVYGSSGKYDLALEYYFKSLKIKEEIGIQRSIAFSVSNIGGVYYRMHRYRQALKYYLRALPIMKELGDQNGIAGILGNIGAAYLKMKQFREALPYLEQCLKIAENINAQNLLIDHYENISQLYDDIGNPKKALEYFKLYQQADKKVFNETRSQQIARLQTQYETEKKEFKINALEREKRIQSLENRVKTIIAGSLLLILILLSIMIYRSYKKYKIEACQKEEKLRNLQQESRLKLFMAGIDKHFLFNSLDSIIGLEKIPNQLKDNLKKLSDLYRYILTSTDRLVIPLKEELEAVKNYLEIEQKILKGRFFFEIPKVEEHLLACEIMPQSLLTLAENAVKHGIYQKENGGTIFIDIRKKNNSLIIEVIDTGVGIQEGVINTGFGLYSVRERLKLYYKNQADFSIKARPEGGTRAIMEVPYVSSCPR
jgi:tetratricopeptide (TPR) repeat protein